MKKIIKNVYGDTQYLTKELNGNRIGSAYESYNRRVHYALGK